MSKDISTLLKESTKGLLSDESLAVIKESFEQAVKQRVSIHVEKALVEQDAEYTRKLEHLLEAIDTDHVKKLHRVVGAIDSNNAAKLQTVVEKYSTALTRQAKQFKNTLVEKLSRYLEVYLEKTLPQTSINEAVRNRKASIVLENLRNMLAVDSALMRESVREAVLDGKTQITEAANTVATLQSQIKQLKNQLAQAQADMVFEQKTAQLPEGKRAYARRVLAGKSADFILENIDYTLSLFDKKEEERLDVLREEAFEKRVVRETPIIEESTESTETPVANPHINHYLSELSKY